jgi:hypothetical protein
VFGVFYFGQSYFGQSVTEGDFPIENVTSPHAYAVVIARSRARVVVVPRQVTQAPQRTSKVVVPV